MGHLKEKDRVRIKELLVKAYFGKEETKTGNQWHKNVMSRILCLESGYQEADYFDLFQQFVWKISPVACVFAVGLCFAITRMDFFSYFELSKIFINNPADFILLALANG